MRNPLAKAPLPIQVTSGPLRQIAQQGRPSLYGQVPGFAAGGKLSPKQVAFLHARSGAKTPTAPLQVPMPSFQVAPMPVPAGGKHSVTLQTLDTTPASLKSAPRFAKGGRVETVEHLRQVIEQLKQELKNAHIRQ